MAATNIKCSQCQSAGAKLFLKGARCLSPKCLIQRRGAAPLGQNRPRTRHRRSRVSEYGIQLHEKQKMKRLYGLDEHQFKSYFDRARKVREATGEVLLQILESRLDNLVYRFGFVPSRATARQLIAHGHVMVNSKKVDKASYLVRPGETISLSTKGLKIPSVAETLKEKDRTLPEWLERKAAVGRMKRLPKREEIEADINEQIVVEYYSR